MFGDYVSGIGNDSFEWPPAGQANAAGGAVLRPGPGFRFPNGYAPGASFCTQSQSPGFHLPQTDPNRRAKERPDWSGPFSRSCADSLPNRHI